MTDENTPSTEDVRNWFAYGSGPRHTWDESRQDFDRWLAAHDAQVRAEALRDAADAMDNTDDPDSLYVSNGDIDLWLRARADRIADTNQEGNRG